MTKVNTARRRRRKSTQRRALAEIKKFQSGKFATSTLIPKSCFSRMARRVALGIGGQDIRFQDKALDGLQTASEAFLVEMLKEANKICTSSGRMTLQGNDLRLAVSIAGKEPFEAISEQEEQQAEVNEYDSGDDEGVPDEDNADNADDDEEFSDIDEGADQYEV